jgi:hypothetical protein
MPWRREELLARAREIREAISILDEDIAYERELIARKVVKPPPPPVYIGTEAKTGYDIYYNPQTKKYEVIDPTTKVKVREEDKIVIEYTASIVTGEKERRGAFEFLDVEITAVTAVKEMDDAEVTRVEDDMEPAVLRHLAEKGWGAALAAFEKTGIAYNGLSIVEEQNHYGYPVPQYPKMAVHFEKTKRSARPKDYPWQEEEIA